MPKLGKESYTGLFIPTLQVNTTQKRNGARAVPDRCMGFFVDAIFTPFLRHYAIFACDYMAIYGVTGMKIGKYGVI